MLKKKRHLTSQQVFIKFPHLLQDFQDNPIYMFNMMDHVAGNLALVVLMPQKEDGVVPQYIQF